MYHYIVVYTGMYCIYNGSFFLKHAIDFVYFLFGSFPAAAD